MQTINLDADLASADWCKQTWDLPPYKSQEFFAIVSDLDAFRQLPVYLAAVQSGLIYDDEWVGDYCEPVTDLGKEWTAGTDATSGITAYGNTKERRKKRRVKLIPKES